MFRTKKNEKIINNLGNANKFELIMKQATT